MTVTVFLLPMTTFFANSIRPTFEGTANFSGVHGAQLNIFVNAPECEVTVQTTSRSPTTSSNSTTDAGVTSPQPLGGVHRSTCDADEPATHDPEETFLDQRVPVVDKVRSEV
ncbi:hypothetical protein PM082_022974 [Marasmius tenuissimus]|nr:hypothetical protein PM082_022974 [Marasmius tenuissimus]